MCFLWSSFQDASRHFVFPLPLWCMFSSHERMWARLLAGNFALWSVFFMEFLSGCFQAFCFSTSSVMYVCDHKVMIEVRVSITSLFDRWKRKIFCRVYETVGGAKRCKAEEITQLSLSSPAVLCLFVFHYFQCTPISYCQIYYTSFIVWCLPICMPNT